MSQKANSTVAPVNHTGSSDVAYTTGKVPTNDTRNFWQSVGQGKAQKQSVTDAAVSTKKENIEAKKATDKANQKQAANAAKNVVDDSIASKAAAAARDAVLKANSATRSTVTAGIVAIAALIAGGLWFLKRKQKKL